MSLELQAFFPSSTHSAIPIAAQVLSTLRNSTGPGKGNDLRPEERAALVGVSALIGCEKVQSRDLVEKTAQKASSVSPAHFRSALRRSREILAALPSDSLSPSSSRRQIPQTSSKSPEKGAAKPITEAAVSPFQTPKKKFKYSSGVDISGLVKHSPARGSPLKQSVTPSKRREALQSGISQGLGQGAGDGDDEVEDDLYEPDIVMTPTKTRIVTGEQEMSVSAETRKPKKDDTSAFLALRPGSGEESSQPAQLRRNRALTPDEGNGYGQEDRRRRSDKERKTRKIRKKRDWTFREEIWGGEDVRAKNERELRDVLGDDSYLIQPPSTSGV